MVRSTFPLFILFITAVTASFLSGGEAAAQTAQPRASDTVPVMDDRIGQLFYANPTPLPDGQPLPAIPFCSVSHVGNKWWITAAHCVTMVSPFAGYIEQYDGDSAKVREIWLAPGGEDIALIEVDSEISTQSFTISPDPAPKDAELTLVGYGEDHAYASAATVKVKQLFREAAVGKKTYKYIYSTSSIQESRTCSGDSGGAVFANDLLYAVHTAGESNHDCTGKIESPMWHSDITHLKDLLEQKMGQEEGPESIGKTSSLTSSSKK